MTLNNLSLRLSASLAACAALAACGGGGGGGLLSSSGDVLDYAPSYADGPTDTFSASLIDDGITGVMSIADPLDGSVRLVNVDIRTSTDRQTAYLSINGGSEKSYPALGGVNASGGAYGTTSGAGYLTFSTLDGMAGTVGLQEGTEGGFGWAGIETRPSNLPSSATYGGFWGGHIYDAGDPFNSGVASGFMTMTVDFAGGDVSGALSGSSSGSITGTVDGNGVTGEFDLVSGDYTGDLTFAGKTFGDSAEVVAGALGGTVRDTGGSLKTFAGTFDGDR